jgi:uncharacterized protein YjbI with pentapeptide repeats
MRRPLPARASRGWARVSISDRDPTRIRFSGGTGVFVGGFTLGTRNTRGMTGVMDLTDAILTNAGLTGADLTNAILTGADFSTSSGLGTADRGRGWDP